MSFHSVVRGKKSDLSNRKMGFLFLTDPSISVLCTLKSNITRFLFLFSYLNIEIHLFFLYSRNSRVFSRSIDILKSDKFAFKTTD